MSNSHSLPIFYRRPSANLLFAVVTGLFWLAERQRQRQKLALLDNRLLADIGLEAGQVGIEVAKPFWRD